MSRYRVELSPRARAELRSITTWWREHRFDPEQFDRELAMAVTLLAEHAEAGAPFLRARRPGVRRMLLRKSQQYLYYEIDPSSEVVHVLAIRHTARKAPPRL
jgi:plasmid stabilization system protein ParE